MPTATWGGGAGMSSFPCNCSVRWFGRQAQQDAESVFGLAQLGLQDGDGGLGAGQDRLGLLHVPLGGGAALKTGLGDLQALPLGLHVMPGDVQPPFQGADGDVEIGHVAGEADQGAVIIGDAGQQAGVGGLDGPAELAPEIDLPVGRQADLGFPQTEAAESRGTYTRT